MNVILYHLLQHDHILETRVHHLCKSDSSILHRTVCTGESLIKYNKHLTFWSQGRELWVMVVSSSPYEHMIGKPNVKYVANMHGNEAVGRELMLHLILYLVQNYESDYYVRWLLDNTRIHVMPSMNPDGYEVRVLAINKGRKSTFIDV